MVSVATTPVLDIKFSEGNLPPIYSALKIALGDGSETIVEVQQLLGDNQVRAVSMRSTDGLQRGTEAVDLEKPISVPVGKPTLGRIFNVIGEPVDEQGEVSVDEILPIHREAPAFTELETKPSIFETGIKVVDLLAPYRRGGKIGLFGGAGVGKTVLIMELIMYLITIILWMYNNIDTVIYKSAPLLTFPFFVLLTFTIYISVNTVLLGVIKIVGNLL